MKFTTGEPFYFTIFFIDQDGNVKSFEPFSILRISKISNSTSLSFLDETVSKIVNGSFLFEGTRIYGIPGEPFIGKIRLESSFDKVEFDIIIDIDKCVKG